MFDADLYPPEWRAMRQAKLEQVGFCCESCGVKHLSLRENTRSGAPYVVYLSIAHKKQYETWKHDADTMVLCQRCHRRYDRQFRRKAGRRYLTPLGYARILVQQHTQLSLAGIARTYDDLRDIVAALPDGFPFDVHLFMNMFLVGSGHYVKLADGVSVQHEDGACEGLAF
jgi:hypothetical protein